jgi:5-methylcytosine-specific restriction endonuclease McrA
MGRKVLVLNADYRALTVCSIYKAFLLVYMEKAEIINSVDNEYLRTVSAAYEMPSVIRLNDYVRVPYKSVMLNRHNIFKRDNYQCVYCGSRDDLTLDHVVPRAKGGKTVWHNLVTACKKCNSRKGDSDPEDVGMKLPYAPYRPSYVVFLRDFSGMADDTWLPYLVQNSHAEY